MPIVKNQKLKQSSKLWIKRHLTDPYVAMAKDRGYRSRAAFKLLEINKKFNILHGVAIDLGAAPGGWSQIATKFCQKVYAIDLLDMEDLPKVEFIKGDFTNNQIIEKLRNNCGKVDVVLSDMAPNTCGIKSADHLKIMALVELAFDFSCKVLNHKGSFVTKIFQGGAEADFAKKLKKFFTNVKYFKPNSSRKDSVEMYIVATGFQQHTHSMSI